MPSARSRAVRGGLALAALALLGLGTTPSASAASTAPAQPSAPAAAEGLVGVYNIRAVHSGKCLGPAGNSTGEGVGIHQQPCDGRPSQRVGLWSYGEHKGTAYYAFVTDSGKCWGESSWFWGMPVRDLVIRTTTCDRLGKSLAYSLNGEHPWAGKQIRTFVDPPTNNGPLCLHVHNAGTGDGVGMITHPCSNPGTGARNDTFEFIPV
ncbi:RICIN domain-containing protein [Streptomyces yaizuensis]|uniref:RICIN domain-containing protein n=1 Tax=Streptomyces yaizuensis TaxID=2989713 RepID=A0ABQ5NXF8_9ACTN|nr:RICIN domain-containing protein [Streptomyces sp. YSPA8]GLF95055.1 RICIN domain-containing protein [Streptomyces sp. YSPA8]